MLTNAAAKAAGALSRAYKLSDQGGLFLLVRPTGTKSWQQKYRWRGREKLLTFGQFPEVNVAQARIRQAEAKDMLERGVDPGSTCRPQHADTFEAAARAWHALHRARWSAVHAGDVIGSLARDVFPAIGGHAIGEVRAAELVQLLERIEASGRIELAKRLRQRLKQIFAYARSLDLVEKNPAAELGAALAGVAIVTPHPALTSIEDCRALLAACEIASARPLTRLAGRFLALTAVRLDAVRGARWEEIDLEEGVWRVPAARMKLAKLKKGEARFDHLVTLTPAAIAVLEAARLISATSIEAANLIFPGRSGRPIGEGAIRELTVRAGYAGRHVPHGWRASFSTIMNEHLGETWSAAIDAALGHAKGDKVEAAYNRAQLLDRRRAVLERWADLLTG